MRALAIFLALWAHPAAARGWAEVSALFAERCVKCHSGPAAPEGLTLDTAGAALLGGWNGPVIVPGDADASPLIRRLRGEIVPRMPLDGPPFLSGGEIATVAAWIEAGAPAGDEVAAPRSEPEEGFAAVMGILNRRCIECHSGNSKLGAPPEGLRLTDHAAVLAGGDRVVVVPGRPEASEIWRRVTGLAEPRMPFDGPPWLTDEEIEAIRAWIEDGAPDGAGVPAEMPAGFIRLRGRLTGPAEIDGAAFEVGPGTRLGDPVLGAPAEMRGVLRQDGTIAAERLRGP